MVREDTNHGGSRKRFLHVAKVQRPLARGKNIGV